MGSLNISNSDLIVYTEGKKGVIQMRLVLAVIQ